MRKDIDEALADITDYVCGYSRDMDIDDGNDYSTILNYDDYWQRGDLKPQYEQAFSTWVRGHLKPDKYDMVEDPDDYADFVRPFLKLLQDEAAHEILAAGQMTLPLQEDRVHG